MVSERQLECGISLIEKVYLLHLIEPRSLIRTALTVQ